VPRSRMRTISPFPSRPFMACSGTALEFCIYSIPASHISLVLDDNNFLKILV
jgi:hypothetical protein